MRYISYLKNYTYLGGYFQLSMAFVLLGYKHSATYKMKGNDIAKNHATMSFLMLVITSYATMLNLHINPGLSIVKYELQMVIVSIKIIVISIYQVIILFFVCFA